MTAYRVYQVDVFTEERFQGNPAGVVPEASGLDDERMQLLARELNNPETIFVFPPRSRDHDVWVRIFTPSIEIPLAGHPTLAAHYVRALEGTQGPGTIRQGSKGGVWTVSVEEEDGDYLVTARQSPVVMGEPLDEGRRARLLAALGLSGSELDPRAPVQIVSTGHSKIILAVESRAALNRLDPDMPALAEVSRATKQDGIFLFTLDVEDRSLLTECRMFAPAIGIPEDPVTGSGQGPLGAYLVTQGLLDVVDGKASFTSLQGRAMGRPGRARVTVEAPDGTPEAVRVGGRVVPVFQTEIDL